MKTRSAVLPLILCETLLLLLVVVPVAHARAFLERLLLPAVPPLAPGEAWSILFRSLVMVTVLQAVYSFRDLYRWNVIMRPQRVVMRLVDSVLIAIVAIPVLHHGMGLLDGAVGWDGRLTRLRIHPLLVVAGTGAAFLASYGLRARWPGWMRGSRFSERVLLAGRGPASEVLAEEIRRRRNPAVELVEIPGPDPLLPDAALSARGVADRLEQHGVQCIVLDRSGGPTEDVLYALRQRGMRIADAPEYYEDLTGRVSVERMSSATLFERYGDAGSKVYHGSKRLVDLLVAGVGLLVAAPLLALVAALIKLDSRGPLLYRQERVGRDGRPFMLTKFRSMRADAEAASGPVWATSDDTRITRVGRWLRKLRIDEIPQLYSVLMNDMSLVGPRPERPFFVTDLERSLPDYGRRHVVKPGITGWAQVNHPYGNTADDAFLKLQFDLFYIKHRSLALDVSILLRTVKVVVLQQGAL